ncbi:hypothetical protein ABZ714_26710 [Streptomyces sp. NPDC006798]|uniref:hypothetical protein n=1 Tax=Streptomyces sp. NPDC006798 TaxID=3155462 RepID=UPI0033D3914F
MDTEKAADELYGLPPAQFTSARDAHAAEARKAGRKPEAKAISALRKPTLAAWAANLLVRRAPAEADRFLQLGRALRQAHRSLDSDQLRTLGHQQHQVITRLAGQAADQAADAGHPLSESVQHDVEQLLRAVLADPDTANLWSAGRLVKAPAATAGFTGLGPDVLPPRRAGAPAPASSTAPPASGTSAPRTAGQREPGAARDRARRDAARRTAKAGKQEADARLTEAEGRVAGLEEELRRARGERTRARTAAQDAAARLQQAEQRAGKARAEADGP